eukprot:GAFH01001246.1.p1 GENE.GAFH01001246.1~~GAFH01001246.1.p1  ORF type:complete len:537 (-),score=118.81 GAFH01001246.1:169-1605(-)
MSGSSVQWFIESDDIFGVAQDDQNPRGFVLTALHRYYFDAESPESIDRIFDAMKKLNIGCKVDPNRGFKKAQAPPPPPPPAAVAPPDHTQPPGNPFQAGAALIAPPAPVAPVSTSARVGLQDFEMLRVVGKGSFGKVLQVRHKATGGIFAMKILKKSELYLRSQIEHTNTERVILATLSHPFMVKLHFAFQNPYKLYMVVDYANGGEIFFHLRRAGRFPEVLATFYIAEVICTMDYLHQHDIIYRDLKPENILLDADGHVKITDFGLSKVGITSVGGSTANGQSTQTFCGTPEYLAPEILQGIGHGKAVDWWSVGILYYEMLTGLPPFYATNRNQMYQNTLKGDLTIPAYVSPEAQDFLRAILMHRPEDRLGSGPSGGQEIKAHPLFRHVDWALLERRQIAPPFKPRLKEGIMDTTNIDPAFLTETPTDSPPSDEDPRLVEALAQKFEDFTFVDPSHLAAAAAPPPAPTANPLQTARA